MSERARRRAGFAALALLCVALVVGVTRPSPFSATESYWAVFDSAHGLGKIDRDVRIAGVKVGSVGEIERVGDDVRAELVVPSHVQVHADARAAMRPHTLFEGSSFVDLDPGSPSAPALEPGDVIPIERTSNYVTLDEALRVLRRRNRVHLRGLTAATADALSGRSAAHLQRLLRGVPGLMRPAAPAARALQGRERSELTGAIAGLSRTVDAVARAEADLAPLVRGTGRTAAGLTVDGGEPLDAALRELPGALAELEPGAPALTRLVDRLDRFAAELNPQLPELAPALAELEPALAAARPVLGRATPLVRDARRIAGRLGLAAPEFSHMLGLIEDPLVEFGGTLDSFNTTSAFGAEIVEQLVGGGFSGFAAAHRAFQTRANNPERPGHVQRSAVTFSPGVLTGLLGQLGIDPAVTNGSAEAPRCRAIERVSARAARGLQRLGVCE